MKFDRKFLIEKLEQNREKHAEEYKEAVEEYWQAVRTELDEAETKYEAREDMGYLIHMPKKCEDHTPDYDRVLQMLGATVDAEVTLSGKDFAKYVLDDWEWKEDFNSTKGSYLNR
jgi:hypothetical protein